MLFERMDVPFELYTVKIREAGDKELLEINERMGLGLNLDEMKRVQRYFKDIGRDPTDIELQAIGQAWSEHCCYKSSKVLLKKYIFGVSNEDVIVQFEDDAGVVRFCDDWAYAVKIESHNHPSAIEPYGGAATGVGGILRDVLNMGAEPVALIDPLFFGDIYTEESIPKGFLHPRYIFEGVVSGIRDYGNRVGIPTVSGLTYFDSSYNFNPLVNVGCVGIVKVDKIVRSRITEKDVNLVIVGGKTGRDGIHGVNFASKVLSESSEEKKSAVQLGNPIIKEPLIHAILEANELGIIRGMKDLGGGGLSSVVGEIVHAGGVGAEIHLDRVPLREEDMAPWEIWISESQERMLVAVRDEDLDALKQIFENWDLDYAVIGRTNGTHRLVIYFKGVKIFDLDLNFVTSALTYHRAYVYRRRSRRSTIPPEPKNYREIFLKVLSSPNVRSKEYVIRQYDHEVKGRTILKPMVGKINHETHSDASILKFENIPKMLAITTAANPQYAKLDPYRASLSSVDEIVRNLVCVGAHPHTMVDCLNFGNPEKPEVMGDMHLAVKGLGDASRKLGIPFVSGNVSLYNETFGRSIPPTATLIGVGIVDSENQIRSSEFKKEGNPIYLVGKTKDELGGSEYFRVLGINDGVVPNVNLNELKRIFPTVLEIIRSGIAVASHDPSHGGLGIAIAEMAIGGEKGCEIDLGDIAYRMDIKLFSESNTRWILEISEDREEDFLEIARSKNIPFVKIGKVGGDSIVFKDGRREFSLEINEVWEVWSRGF